MIQHSFGVRVLFCVLAAVQLALPPAAFIADALLPGQVHRVGVHVEERSGEHDRPPHPHDCALCQILGQPGMPLALALAAPAALSSTGRPTDRLLLLPHRPERRLPPPRGPPPGS